MVTFTPIGGNAADAATVTTPAAKQTVGQDAFLQLLVAQIRNQNPLDPADGVEFLSQLAQFSQLEQTIGVRDEINGLRTQVTQIIEAMPKDPTARESGKSGEDKNV
ncbi:MAG TPA: flagellar hook capping FlgD N-terminal domain-containing protein [Bryobacteraceae bacterium]|nr:flagellar hook capping FlgD N-terminal domain-containing protein [Bryobacteraceae bacterium]